MFLCHDESIDVEQLVGDLETQQVLRNYEMTIGVPSWAVKKIREKQ